MILSGLDETIKNLDGEEIPYENAPLTFKRAIITALLMNEKDMKSEDKLRYYDMAKRVMDNAKHDYKIEEISTIKSAVLKTWSTLVAGRVSDYLERIT